MCDFDVSIEVEYFNRNELRVNVCYLLIGLS